MSERVEGSEAGNRLQRAVVTMEIVLWETDFGESAQLYSRA